MIATLALTEVYFLLNRVYALVFVWRAMVLLGLLFNQQTVVTIRSPVCFRQHSKLLVHELTLFHVIYCVRNQRANLAQALV